MLQTSLPTKDQQQKIGGTDNPAFLADTYIGDRIVRTGLTKIVRLPQSTVNGESLGIELMKENDKQIYMCKHSDGSKGKLIYKKNLAGFILDNILIFKNMIKCIFQRFSRQYKFLY